MHASETSKRWRPATVDAAKQIVRQPLSACSAEEADAFKRYSVEECKAHLIRYGTIERVVVAALNGNEAMYWEDVEQGFNISAVDMAGAVLEHNCDQDNIAQAIRRRN